MNMNTLFTTFSMHFNNNDTHDIDNAEGEGGEKAG